MKLVLSKPVAELSAADLRPLVGQSIEVHVIDGPKHITNYDETYFGVLEGYHLSNPNACRVSAGDGSLSLSTYGVQMSKYQIVTIHRIEE